MNVRKQNGFTIIELVLVLAIAGLIFIIVFLALPQLQSSRRDTQRRKDVGKLIGALDTYATNNSGTYPIDQAATDGMVSTYVDNFNDPSSGTTYTVVYTTVAPVATGDISYSLSASCGSDGGLTSLSGSNKKYAVAIKLEKGFYCQDNQ